MEMYELLKGEYQLIAKKQGSEIVKPTLFSGLEFSLKELWVYLLYDSSFSHSKRTTFLSLALNSTPIK